MPGEALARPPIRGEAHGLCNELLVRLGNKFRQTKSSHDRAGEARAHEFSFVGEYGQATFDSLKCGVKPRESQRIEQQRGALHQRVKLRPAQCRDHAYMRFEIDSLALEGVAQPALEKRVHRLTAAAKKHQPAA